MPFVQIITNTHNHMLVLDYIKIKHTKSNTFPLKLYEASGITMDQHESAINIFKTHVKNSQQLIYLKSIWSGCSEKNRSKKSNLDVHSKNIKFLMLTTFNTMFLFDWTMLISKFQFPSHSFIKIRNNFLSNNSMQNCVKLWLLRDSFSTRN